MAKFTGKTFEHREALKALGAKYDGNGKFWYIGDYAVKAIDEARKLGLTVTMGGDAPANPKPAPERNPEPATPDAWEAPAVPAEPEPSREPVVQDALNLADNSNIKTRVFVSYDSLAAMVSAAKASPVEESGSAWAGATFARAVELATDGWDRGVYLAEKARALITADHVLQRTRRYSVAGGAVNVGRMLSGNPLHMVSRPRRDGSKIITLYVDTTASAMVNADSFVVRAAAVAAIVDVLENNGYSAEIIAVSCAHAHNNRPGWQILTKLKSAGEPLNLSDVAFGLGHPAMLRQLAFKIIKNLPVVRDMHGYMGIPVYGDPMKMEAGEYRVPLYNANPKSKDFDTQVREIFKAILPEGLPVQLTD